jgi:hypothetical protein
MDSALKEPDVNNPQSIWGWATLYDYSALKELNISYGKYLSSILIPDSRRRLLYSSSNDFLL